jgi:hypothetical protein
VRVAALAFAALVLAAAASAATKPPLTVTYWPHGAATATPERWTLGCGPARGTHPSVRATCAELKAHAAELGPATSACRVLAPVDGPQARIVGTWAGKQIDRTYRPGCPGWDDLRLVLTGR